MITAIVAMLHGLVGKVIHLHAGSHVCHCVAVRRWRCGNCHAGVRLLHTAGTHGSGKTLQWQRSNKQPEQ